MRNQDETGTELRLPFSGFYQTVHEQQFDLAAEAASVGTDAVDWPVVRLGYAQAYMREVARLIRFDLSFSRLSSPDFYNFETDEILVRVRPDRIFALHDEIMADPNQASALRVRVRDALSPRAGFAPWFPAELDDWGPVTQWAPAQLSVLLDHSFARAGVAEAEIAESLSDRTLELVAGAPRADERADRSEEPTP
jgi:hypothetical protein